MTDSNVEYLIEIQGVYDGWSIAVINEPTYAYVNRWATKDDPLLAEPGYERRFRMTEEYIDRSGITRGRISKVRF